MSKYEALPQFLGQADRAAHRMSFSEIEGVLGFKLPKSAYKHEAWWSNNETGHSHARAWLKFGWRTEAIDLTRRQVTFRRSLESPLAGAPPQKRDPWGCMAGTVTILPDTDLTAPSGDKWNAEEGRLFNE
jgi:hypothetical protein